MYASTGLPLFIDSLCEAGALKENLVAFAGGALVAPLSGVDLKLDIGGRTLEVVESILNGKEIPVIKSETGGYFSCRLSLNLKSMERLILSRCATVSQSLAQITHRHPSRMNLTGRSNPFGLFLK